MRHLIGPLDCALASLNHSLSASAMLFDSPLLEPLSFILRPDKRIYFLYSLTSIAAAFLILKAQKKEGHLKVLKKIFDKRIWLNPSAVTDYKLFLFNILFKGALFSLVVLSSFPVSRSILLFLQDQLPSFQSLRPNSFIIALTYTLGSFVVLDFSRFFQHYCMHHFTFLWRFHQIHHSATVLTPMTLYRTHPLESIISSARRVLAIGFSTGVFSFIFGAKINAFDLIGINIFDFIFNMMASNLRHSHVWLSFGLFNYILISPAQHQIHHSRSPKHFNKNFGIALSLWDQFFRSFYSPKEKEFIRFGLPGEGVWSFKKSLIKPFRKK